MAGKMLVIYADGGISPKRCGAGVVARDDSGVIAFAANRSLPRMTNNEAEYAALVMALEMAARHRAAEVEMRMDSEVVVNQMIGRFAVNSPKLKPWHRRACAVARRVPTVRYVHVRREQNGVANALAAEAVQGRAWHTEDRS